MEAVKNTPFKLDRKPGARPLWFGLTPQGKPINPGTEPSAERPWRLRLSGPPIGGLRMEEKKREGLFKPDGQIIQIGSEKWIEYQGRNIGSVRNELRKGDLIWLEPTNRLVQVIVRSPARRTSNHYSGRDGESLARSWKRRIPKHLHPDSWNSDGKVDRVTNLFGQVQDQRSGGKALSFASRIRPENLVFENAASRCVKTVLAPMAMPHPGCLAFYRDNTSPDDVGFEDDLRGYKVYRTATETGTKPHGITRCRASTKTANLSNLSNRP